MNTLTSIAQPKSHLHEDETALPREYSWMNVLESLKEPATLVARALSEIDKVQRTARREPRKAAVMGTNVDALLATLILRLRSDDVLTMGRIPPPLFSPSRLKGLPGWKHVWMSPALRQVELVEEVGARYASASDLSFEAAAEKFGPFDVIVAAVGDEFPMLHLARRLAPYGVLLDLTLGHNAIEVWTACSIREFMVKHQVRPGIGSVERLHAERALRELALAEALHPGWLAQMLVSFSKTGEQRPVLLES